MKKNYSSWKQKIDPAFPKLIKLVLTFLKSADMQRSSGWLVMEPDNLKLLEKKDLHGWIKNYQGAVIGVRS